MEVESAGLLAAAYLIAAVGAPQVTYFRRNFRKILLLVQKIVRPYSVIADICAILAVIIITAVLEIVQIFVLLDDGGRGAGIFYARGALFPFDGESQLLQRNRNFGVLRLVGLV